MNHRLTVIVDANEISGWTDYEVSISMIQACSQFQLRRAFDRDAWDLMPRDAHVRILIDGICILDGFIDKRTKLSDRREGSVMAFEGRDWAGRLVDESAPSITYDGLEMSAAIGKLVSPWYKTVTLSDARDRNLRRGKGFKVATGTEPIVVHTSRQGGGRVHPGQTRASVIEEVTSEAGLIAWGASDGSAYFVGQPNRSQAPQYLLLHTAPTSPLTSTVTSLHIDEDNGERYSLIACVGTGGATEADYGISVSTRRAVAYDNPDSLNGDGTGRDFVYPKRLLMPEKDFGSIEEAKTIATRERQRRDFRRTSIRAVCPLHGQAYANGPLTLFSINTIANVVDEELRYEADCLIYATTFRGSRADGETTDLELVPKDTEIVR